MELSHADIFLTSVPKQTEKTKSGLLKVSTRRKRRALKLPAWLRSVSWQSTAVCFQSTELKQKKNRMNIHNNTFGSILE